MKPSSCLHPISIRTPQGKFVKVPCGKCSACVVNKGYRMVNKLDDNLKGYPFQFFVTLTFSDENLPRAFYDETNNCMYSDTDCDYDGVVYSQCLNDFNEADKEFVFKQLDNFGFLPCLSHSVLIKFKKRFRFYLSKLNNSNYEDVFIYGCGEYGPTTYRPHYHLIFGFKSDIKTSIFEECVRNSWSFQDKTDEGVVRRFIGFISVERVVARGCESYCAKYISCTTHLPKIYAVGKFKPFACGSNRANQRLSSISQADVREVFNNTTFEVSTIRHGKKVVESLPSVYYSRYFPRVSRFDSFSSYELYQLYGISIKYSESATAYSCFEQDYLKQVDWDYLIERDSPFDGRDFSIMPLTVLQMAVFYCCFVDLEGNFIDDSFIRKRNFMRLWYISRTVVNNSKILDIEISTYVDKIKDFYSKFELNKLKKFYEYQNELIDDVYNPQPLGAIFTMYYNTDSDICDISYYLLQFGWNGEKLEDIIQQRQYKELSDGILRDTIKTKKRNDYLFSKGVAHSKYVAHLSKSVDKFLSNF